MRINVAGDFGDFPIRPLPASLFAIMPWPRLRHAEQVKQQLGQQQPPILLMPGGLLLLLRQHAGQQRLYELLFLGV
ncbi:hypothetical protein D3C76_1327140 [compost metagenome]